jgi:hypothetical protein
MIIHVKQSFEIRNESGEKWGARNGDIVVPPDWATQNEYFRSLCDSGKISVHVDSKALDLEVAKEEMAKQDEQKQETKRANRGSK